MNVATKKSQEFVPAVIDAFKNDPEFCSHIEEQCAKWAMEVCKETIESFLSTWKIVGKYADKNAPIEIAVSVSIGHPNEDDESEDEDDEE